MSSKFAPGWAVLLGLTLAACASDEYHPPSGPVCPAAGIIAGAGSISKFRTQSDMPNDVDLLVRGNIEKVRLSCAKEKSGNLAVTLSFDVSAVAGPIAPAQQVSLPYYVVVLTKDQKIVSKKTLDWGGSFGGPNLRAASREQIQLSVPGKGEDYEILVGFQLTRDELGYNLVR